MQGKLIGAFGSVSLAAALLTGCGATPSNQSNSQGNSSTSGTGSTSTKQVTVGYMNWAEDVAASYLWKYILEQHGYQVTMKSLSPGPVWEGLGTGSINVFFDSWMPYVDKQYMNKYGKNITTINQWYGGVTKEGFVVPDYVHIKTESQLKAYASKVGGRIIGIESGSSEMGQAKKALKTYNLPYTLVASSTPAMLSELQKAYAAKKPIVVTLWSPHWAFAKYHLHYIKDPKGVFGKPGHIQTAANTGWVKNHPQAVKWFKNFHLSQSQLGTLEEDIAQDSNNPSVGVKKWVGKNQKLIQSWIS